MVESGIMEGLGVNGLVVGSAQRRSIQKKQPGSGFWTSFIKCISATSITLSPLVIFKGNSVQQQLFYYSLINIKDGSLQLLKNAWTTDSTTIEWLEKVFIRCIQCDK